MSLDSKGSVSTSRIVGKRVFLLGERRGVTFHGHPTVERQKKKHAFPSEQAERNVIFTNQINALYASCILLNLWVKERLMCIYIYMSTSEVSLQFLKVFTNCNPDVLTRKKKICPPPPPHPKKKKNTNKQQTKHQSHTIKEIVLYPIITILSPTSVSLENFAKTPFSVVCGFFLEKRWQKPVKLCFWLNPVLLSV